MIFFGEIFQKNLKAEWFHKGEPISKGTKYEMVDETTVHRLIINDSIGDDEGEYSVKFKEASSQAKLTIRGKSVMLIAP